MDNRPIGVFDSGLGGLSCLKELERELPHEDLIYFGDTARTPYGDKTPETIKYFTCQIADFLVSKGVKMLVIACNTISALCTELLRQRHPDIIIVDIITPTVTHLTSKQHDKAIGIIATKATINSGLYEKLLYEGSINTKVYSKACPLLVPLIEGGFREGVVAETVTKHYLDQIIPDNNVGSLILGCTHYPFIQSAIKKNFPELELINPATILSGEVKRILEKKDMLTADKNKGKHSFFASNLSETFTDMVKNISPDDDYDIEIQTFKEIYQGF